MNHKKYSAFIVIFCFFILVGCSNNHESKDKSNNIMEQQKGDPEFAQQEIDGDLHNKWYKNGIKGNNVKVAILDTGVDKSNKDLAIVKGVNFVGNNPKNFSDDNGHGTKVAGIIGARENNYNMRGIAPKSDLYIAKVADENGNVTYKNLIEGINWAIKQKVDVINISLEFPKGDPELHEAIKKAASKNIIIVASSGNIQHPNDTKIAFPGAYSEAISVGMLNTKGKIFSDEFKKKNVDVYAPGEDIVSLYFNNKMTLDTGASFATAYTSGYSALLIQNKRKLGKSYTKVQIQNELQNNLQKYIGDDRPASYLAFAIVKIVSFLYLIGLGIFILVYFFRKRKKNITFPKKIVFISASVCAAINILAGFATLLAF